MSESRRPRRRAALRLTLVAISIVVAVLDAEAVLRVSPFIDSSDLIAFDTTRGWRLRAGVAGWVSDENRFVHVAINAQGFRDVDHAPDPPAALRVAVVGDSFVEGVNLGLANTLPAQLQRDLAGRVQREVRCWNFGVDGYGTLQELMTYQHDVAPQSPDVVALVLYPGNDIIDNARALDLNPRPFATFDGGAMRIDLTHVVPPGSNAEGRHPLIGRIRRDSRLAALAVDVLTRPRASTEPAPDPLDAQIYAPPSSPALTDAWDVTERLLTLFKREVESHGSQFWLIVLWTPQQVNPDVARTLAAQLHVQDLWYPQRRLDEFAQRQGIRVVTLGPEHREIADGGTTLNGGYVATAPPGTGHWNERGTALAARIIGDALSHDLAAARPGNP